MIKAIGAVILTFACAGGIAALLTLAGCTLPSQSGMHAGRTFVPTAGSDGGGGGGSGM